MKKGNRILSILLMICLLTINNVKLSVAEQANAENANPNTNTGIIDEQLESIQEQLEALEDNNNLTETQKEIIIEKLTMEETDISVIPRAVTWNYLNGFTIWKQSESYYCVPACTKAAMQYLTGSSATQAKIASDLGTTSSGTSIAAAKTYLNNKQSNNLYVSVSATATQATMLSHFSSAINTYDAPPILDTKFSSSNGWPYNASAHAILITGARSDRIEYRVADPYIQWIDSSASMYYNKIAGSIYRAITDRGIGYIF